MNSKPADPIATFEAEKIKSIDGYASDLTWQNLSKQWLQRAFEQRYMYNFTWLGRPIIQTPIDIVAMQELIWSVKPDLIIETGVAHGGSLVFSASMLALLDYCEAVETGSVLDTHAPRRRVLGIDIDIRAHNRAAIEAHPLANRIDMIQGSSIAPETLAQVHKMTKGFEKILVCLDSNHTHEHVLAELEAYTSLIPVDSYCVVFDTIIEDMPATMFPDRPWSCGNNPKTAVQAFLQTNADFQIDHSIEDKLLITVAPNGFLKRIR